MTKNPHILLLVPPHDPTVAQLRARFPAGQVTVGPRLQKAGQTVPAEWLRGVDALFCSYPPGNFAEFDRLQWVQLSSAGYAQVLDLPILERRIRVTTGVGNFDIPIAEWNLMMMLWWHRNMLEAQASQRIKSFDKAAKYERELRGSTVGFYGYGGIARETARLAKALGLKVWALTRGEAGQRPLAFRVEGTGDPDGLLPDRVFGPEAKEEFLRGLDYLIVTVPLTRATRGTIGEKELRLLKPSAVLINCARAAIIDEEAYVRCLREGWIRGSSTDVHYTYPLPPEHPLWTLPNLIMTAHVSGASAGEHYLPRAYSLFAQNVDRFCADQPLLNELTPAQLRGE